MKSKTYMQKYHSKPEPVLGTIIKIIACLAITASFLVIALIQK